MNVHHSYSWWKDNSLFVETIQELLGKLTIIFEAAMKYSYYWTHYHVLLLSTELMACTTDRNPNNNVEEWLHFWEDEFSVC